MDKTTLALALIGGLHVLGAVLLFALLFERRELRSWWPRDERGGPEDPPPAPPLGGPPLGAADPADVRLRTEHDQLGRRRRRVRSAPETPREPTPRAPAR